MVNASTLDALSSSRLSSGYGIAAALAALTQENRLAIYRLLVERGPAGEAAGAIAEALDMPASAPVKRTRAES